MDDRELLELAAKAAGFNYNPTIYQGGSLWGCFNSDKSQTTYAWNPLTNDGDALRLAVKLGLLVDCASACARPLPDSIEWQEASCADQYAATRRAIVRAVAAIGKDMV